MKRIRCKHCLVDHDVEMHQLAERLRCGTPGCGLPFRASKKLSGAPVTMSIDPADAEHWLQSGRAVEIEE